MQDSKFFRTFHFKLFRQGRLFSFNYQRGQSLFEIVLALGIVTLILVALVSLGAVSIRNTSFARNSTLATRYSQEATEWLRGQRDSDWTTFITKIGTWCISSSPPSWPAVASSCSSGDYISQTEIFLREVTISYDSLNDIVSANIKVTWSDAQGVHDIKSDTFFTNWKTQ